MYVFNPIFGFFLKRRKRFFIDVLLESGDIVVAHCHNTGKILDMMGFGSICCLSEINGKLLKYKWQMSFFQNTWVGINTMVPNILLKYILSNNLFNKYSYQQIEEYDSFICEPKIINTNHKLDFLTFKNKKESTIIEVKNVHWRPDFNKPIAIFPYCPTTRGASHLSLLSSSIKKYNGSFIVFIVQRNDCDGFSIDKKIDFVFFNELTKALINGVKILVLRCIVSPGIILIDKEIVFNC
jgi:sugar fermentation stimulation protein A